MNETEYQLRINGAPVKWYSMFGQEPIRDFIATQSDNPKDRVDLVIVTKTSIVSSYAYGQFERHFKEHLEAMKPSSQ